MGDIIGWCYVAVLAIAIPVFAIIIAGIVKETREENRRLRIELDEGAFPPERAHDIDAGMDLRSPTEAFVEPGSSVSIDTGVHIEIPNGYGGLLVSKSGLNVRYGITSTGLIDSGYTGSIAVKLYNQGWETYHVHVGDKISQLVVFPISTCKFTIVNELERNTERGDSGFGSTGR